MKMFLIRKKSKKSKARLGVIKTAHGEIKTPSLVPVATKGTLKSIPPREIAKIGVQVAFVNTFHLVDHPGADVVQKFGGIHKYANLDMPLMSDSAGFQVFSLGSGKTTRGVKTREGDEAPLLGITEEGVRFRSPRDGREMMFTPELSIKNQQKIGADIIMAFDECIYLNADYKYTKEATDRTHRWLGRCIKAMDRGKRQYLYGIIQGGRFKDLRVDSAKFIGEQDVDGVAIGGVSVGEGKKELYDQVKWVSPYLPSDKPVHLLGVGRIEDVYGLVKYGIDTFDCVEPTRLARNGIVFTKTGNKFQHIDLLKTKYLRDKNPIQKICKCYACQNFSLSFLHHLFKERELLGYYLATYHNLYFFEQIFLDIHAKIAKGMV
jgi:queuine tRNA-ribosyltransferase